MPLTSDRTPSVSIRGCPPSRPVSRTRRCRRVINGSPRVRPSTREAVLETIARLDFRPNRAARALAGGPVQSVTVLTSNTRQYGFAAALEGIEEAHGRLASARSQSVKSGTESAVRDAVERAIEPAGALTRIAYDRPGIRPERCSFRGTDGGHGRNPFGR